MFHDVSVHDWVCSSQCWPNELMNILAQGFHCGPEVITVTLLRLYEHFKECGEARAGYGGVPGGSFFQSDAQRNISAWGT